ncbi:MAG: hypothetical protein QM723_20630 [Myxococcaceae bacterium]
MGTLLLALVSSSWMAPIPSVALEDAFDPEAAAKWSHAYRLPVPGENVDAVIDTPQPPPPADAPVQVAEAAPVTDGPSHARIAIAAEAGLPTGAGGTLQLAPIDWLRFSFGGGTNGLSPNVRAGLALAPFHTVVRPVVWGEVTHGFAGDAGWILKSVSPGLAKASRISGYDVASMELSLELGSKWLCFFLRGGVSFVDVALATPSLEVSGDTVEVKGGHLKALVPSGRLGLMVGLY